jgi:hypothetical protein
MQLTQDLDLDWTDDAFAGKEDLLDEIVALHFVKEGKFELVDLFSKESRTKIDPNLTSTCA